MSLTPRQKRFASEFLIDLNGEQAAIRAGYSAKWARSQASHLATNPNIAAEIIRLQAKRSERTEVTADRVLTELGCLAFYDPAIIASARMRGPEDIANLPEPVRRAIVGWKWDATGNFTLMLSPKVPSLVEIGRHLGIAQKHELTGKDGKDLIPPEAAPSKVALALLAVLRGGEPEG